MRSGRATRQDYLLVGGLALLCFALAIVVMHRGQGTAPSAPPVAATATLQLQAAATQAVPATTVASQPGASSAAPGQPPATAVILAVQPTPMLPTPIGTASGTATQPTVPLYRQDQNM